MIRDIASYDNGLLQSDAVSNKEWILQYAECQTDSDDEDEYVGNYEEEICISKCEEADDTFDRVFSFCYYFFQEAVFSQMSVYS